MNVKINCDCGHRIVKENVILAVKCPKCGTVYYECYDKEDKERTWKKLKRS